MANLSFNAHEVEPQESFDPIPAGSYTAVVTSSQMKQTKNGSGNYLEFEFVIIDGQYKGRKLWDRLNLEHQNQIAVKIARSKLSALCRATGVMTPRDSVELHNIPVALKVGLKPRKDNDELVNEIRSYAKRESSSNQPQQASNSTPPWRR